MVRAIIGTITTLLAGVRMLTTSNETWLDMISDWVVLSCGLALLLLLMYDARQRWHPAKRIYRKGVRDQEARTQRAIDNLRRSPFFTPEDYDPRTGVITAGFGIKRTWRRRAVDAVLWLANHRVLPRWLTIVVLQRLGWTYRGQVQTQDNRNP